MVLRGRAWLFGDGVNTDQITPGRFLFSPPKEAAPHTLSTLNPDFAGQVKPGDLVVAGLGFGCGSAREIAVQVLKFLDVGCILAESFSRTFFRNSVAIGLPVLPVKRITSEVRNGEELEVDLESGVVKNLTKGACLSAEPLPSNMLSIINQGGIVNVLRQMAESGKIGGTK